MTNLQSLKIAVVCGGVGAEREISLISGDAIYQALSIDGKNIVKIELTGAEISPLKNVGCDLAFLALHGEFGEDGGAQSLLEEAKIPYTGSDVNASKMAMDKFASKQKFIAGNVPVADGIIARRAESFTIVRKNLREQNLIFPLVVKPNGRGSSVGVSIVREDAELNSALTTAWECDEFALIEKFIKGREITAGLVDGVCLPLVEAIAPHGFYDYQAKYFTDATEYFCPAKIDPETTKKIQETAQTVWRILNLRDLARVDFMFAENIPFVLEANTLPGFTPHSLLPKAARAIGDDFPTLCWKIVETAAKRQNL